MPRLGLVLAVAFLAAAPARAAEGGPDLDAGVAVTPARDEGIYAHTFGTLALGKGFRFNNPYRLATPIGDNPESVSWTATYLDLGLGATFGPVRSLQHGAEISLGVATDGIGQSVLGLSYVALYPVLDQVFLRGRAGFPIVLAPDTNIGFELGVGGAWLFTGGIGATAELTGSLFYGAATLDKSSTTIPLMAFELGVWIDYEVLP